MNKDNQSVSDETIEENTEVSQEDMDGDTEVVNEEMGEETQDDAEEDVTHESDESGQDDTEETDPEWMKKRLKRQQKKMNERHQRETQALNNELTQMRSLMSNQTVSNQPQQQVQEPAKVDPDDPVAIINAIMDQREQQKEQAKLQKAQNAQLSELQTNRLELASELQALQDASNNDVDPCVGQVNGIFKVNESMFDNAMMLDNGASVLRTICSGSDWKRIQSLPKIQQAREMGKYSRQLAAKMGKRTKSGAPNPISHSRGNGGTSFSKSPNEMSAQDYKAALREGTL
jgi:hypothetical protein